MTDQLNFFPALCAHRGLSKACPENTLPAFGAALAVGAQEIEFDVRLTRDHVPIICHDARVDRVTDGHGAIHELSWEETRRFDAGVQWGPQWRGVRIPLFEDVLRLNSGKAVMNIHVKDHGDMESTLHLLCDLLRQHQQGDRAYLSLESPASLEIARTYAPEISRSCLFRQNSVEEQIDTALAYGCKRLQFFRQVTDAQIHRARDAGLICNLFWSDEVADARRYVDRGIDVILTNCAHQLLADGF